MPFKPRPKFRCIHTFEVRDGGLTGPVVSRADVDRCINPWCGVQSEERLEHLKRKVGATLAAPVESGMLLCRR